LDLAASFHVQRAFALVADDEIAVDGRYVPDGARAGDRRNALGAGIVADPPNLALYLALIFDGQRAFARQADVEHAGVGQDGAHAPDRHCAYRVGGITDMGVV